MNTDLRVNTESVVSVFIVYTQPSVVVVLLFSIECYALLQCLTMHLQTLI